MPITALTTVAALLLSTPTATPPTAPTPAPTAPIPAAMAQGGGELDVVIEMFAAPYFGLSVDEAWYAYDSGALKVERLEESHYLAAYGDGILEIVLDDSNL